MRSYTSRARRAWRRQPHEDFLEKDGQLLTPALSSGLLAGNLRADLLASGRAREAVLTLNDLDAADVVYLGNSVRGLVRAQRIDR